VYDAVVVGARCAGATTALLLARRGHRVLLVDRDSFPSDLRLSTHLIWPPGIAHLQRWGLLGELVGSGCPPLATGTMDVGDFSVTGRFPAVDGVRDAYAPRRSVLDGILVRAATAAGVELWERCTVDGLLSDDGSERVGGIEGRIGGGRRVSARARIVIGADGRRSAVARLAGAPTYDERPRRQGTYFTYWSGLPAMGNTLYLRPYRSVVAYPTHDELTLVSVNWPVDDYAAVRGDIAGNYARTIAEVAPDLADLLTSARREDRWIGAAIPAFFRRPHGPGWALVGDAGYVLDPCTAQGITDAFSHAELLAEAVDAGLTGRADLQAALAGYERRRNEAVRPMYEFTYAQAGLEPPPPEMAQLFVAMQHDPELTERFLGVFAGSVAVPDFFGALAEPAAPDRPDSLVRFG
jgi:2-polyprenyl-6-methoxyphenol hydroxylase-like FAD-dependent oxidoreductase